MEADQKTKTSEYLKGIVANLPEGPGIYQYLNAEGVIIYVGKAKNLKRRVYSYFSKEHEPGKTRVLVSKIADIRYIVVNSEEDALLLENNLIKKYKPRYNVLLKDDKTYPSICVQNEYFPRIFKTRKIIRNGSSYYGPYSHMPSMNAVLDLIKHLYPLRTCNLNLSPENIRAGQTYHLNLQLGDPVQTVIIPRGSFYQASGGEYMYVVDEEGRTARRRPVRIGRQNPQYYEIVEGLQPGDKVIISGYDLFGENERLILR